MGDRTRVSGRIIGQTTQTSTQCLKHSMSQALNVSSTQCLKHSMSQALNVSSTQCLNGQELTHRAARKPNRFLQMTKKRRLTPNLRSKAKVPDRRRQSDGGSLLLAGALAVLLDDFADRVGQLHPGPSRDAPASDAAAALAVMEQ